MGAWPLESLRRVAALRNELPRDPDFPPKWGYFEAKRVLNPRWYVAVRTGFLHTDLNSGGETYEVAAGFRPNACQLIKAGYISVATTEWAARLSDACGLHNSLTTLHPLSTAVAANLPSVRLALNRKRAPANRGSASRSSQRSIFVGDFWRERRGFRAEVQKSVYALEDRRQLASGLVHQEHEVVDAAGGSGYQP